MSMTGDLQTMQRHVMSEIDRSRAIDADIVTTCICDAIEEYRWKPFHFNTDVFQFTMSAGDSDYDLDTLVANNYLTLLELWVTHPTTARESQVFECGLTEFRERQNRNGAFNSRPLDLIWHSQQLLVTPTPDADYSCVMDYVKDIGTPTYNWDAAEAEWDFLDPAGSALAPGYTSAWFTYGYELIRHSAKRRIYESFLKDMEAAQTTVEMENRAVERLSRTFRMRTPRRAARGV